MHDSHMHNGPLQVLILFFKSSKDGTHLALGGNLLQICAASYRIKTCPHFMVLTKCTMTRCLCLVRHRNVYYFPLEYVRHRNPDHFWPF